jgi:hypothetical protein
VGGPGGAGGVGGGVGAGGFSQILIASKDFSFVIPMAIFICSRSSFSATS